MRGAWIATRIRPHDLWHRPRTFNFYVEYLFNAHGKWHIYFTWLSSDQHGKSASIGFLMDFHCFLWRRRHRSRLVGRRIGSMSEALESGDQAYVIANTAKFLMLFDTQPRNGKIIAPRNCPQNPIVGISFRNCFELRLPRVNSMIATVTGLQLICPLGKRNRICISCGCRRSKIIFN